jgi:hypothetical protein
MDKCILAGHPRRAGRSGTGRTQETGQIVILSASVSRQSGCWFLGRGILEASPAVTTPAWHWPGTRPSSGGRFSCQCRQHSRQLRPDRRFRPVCRVPFLPRRKDRGAFVQLPIVDPVVPRRVNPAASYSPADRTAAIAASILSQLSLSIVWMLNVSLASATGSFFKRFRFFV